MGDAVIQERRKQVRVLRTCARNCGVPLQRDVVVEVVVVGSRSSRSARSGLKRNRYLFIPLTVTVGGVMHVPKNHVPKGKTDEVACSTLVSTRLLPPPRARPMHTSIGTCTR